MEPLKIDSLNGVSKEIESTIYEAMETCSNAQRLCVCLYLMSDLPEYSHSLEKIEENLSKIFPPSIPHGNTPETYKDFAATTIRQYFNYETIAVRRKEIKQEDRLWDNPQRGYWVNTPVGNSYALKVLQQRDIVIEKRNVIQKPTEDTVDYSNRKYLDEGKAGESLRARQNTQSAAITEWKDQTHLATNPLVDKGERKLIGSILELLQELSMNSPQLPKQTNPATLNMSGSPSLIYQFLTMQQNTNITIVEFHLSQQGKSWKIDIELIA